VKRSPTTVPIFFNLHLNPCQDGPNGALMQNGYTF
jgi:hypothetical protein